MKGDNLHFAGYVPLYRGLIRHTIDGRLTNTEALVLVWLVMLANHETGGYTINQPTLRFYLPGLTKGAAQRALEQLQAKGFIYRDVTPRDQSAYPYWVQGFRPTDGIHKGSQLDLSEVFATKDTSKLKYLKVDPATETAMSPAIEPATANSNYKGKLRIKKRESLLTVIEDGEPCRSSATDVAMSAPVRGTALLGESRRDGSHSETAVNLQWEGTERGWRDAKGNVPCPYPFQAEAFPARLHGKRNGPASAIPSP